jgi:hypothetical protein
MTIMSIASHTFSSHSCQQALSYGATILYQAALDSVSYSTVFLVAAVAANFFVPFLAAPLAITAISIYFANTTLILIKDIHSEPAIKLKNTCFAWLDSLERNAPYIKVIVLISGLALSYLSLAAASALIILSGILIAVQISLQKGKELQRPVVPIISHTPTPPII